MNLDYSLINPFLLFFTGVLSLYFSSEIIINQSVLISNNFNVSKMTKVVAGKKLWNYDALEPTEKKGAI